MISLSTVNNVLEEEWKVGTEMQSWQGQRQNPVLPGSHRENGAQGTHRGAKPRVLLMGL